MLPIRFAYLSFFSLLCFASIVAAQSAQDLSKAIDRGDAREVARLIEADPGRLNKTLPGKNETPLARAISLGQAEVVDVLLRNNATIGNYAASRSAIMLAIIRRNPVVVSKVLEHGGDFKSADRNGETPLMYAVRYQGQPEWIKSMVAGGAELDTVNRSQQTALHMACYYNRPQLATALLEAGADISLIDGAGNSPFMAACLASPEFAQTLLSRGARLRIVNGQNQVPLHLAAQSGNVELVEEILKSQPALDSIDKRGMTPLAYAVQNRRIEAAIVLLKAGANPNVVASQGNPVPAICQAATMNQPKLVNALLDAKANPNAVDSAGNTPLHFAVFESFEIGGPRNPSSLSSSDSSKQFEQLADALLKAGADPNQKNNAGETPFQVAAAANKLAAVEWLAKHTRNLTLSTDTSTEHWVAQRGTVQLAKRLAADGKFDFARQNSDGQTPLNLAAGMGHADLVEWMLANSPAVLELRDQSGMTPLLAAAAPGHAAVVDKLIKAGADLLAKDQTGQTALHLAAWSGDAATVKSILAAGGDATATTSTGYTPLHAAAWRGDLKIATALHAQGAKLDAADSDGWTPLHKAAHQGHAAMTKWLLEQGADRNATNAVGMKAEDLAKQPEELGF